MKDKEEGLNYEDDLIPRSEYMSGMIQNRCVSDIPHYYFFRPGLPSVGVKGKTQEKYDERYLDDQECYFHPQCEYLDDPVEREHMRRVWKKEKNRLAARKSREKKMVHLKELERRESVMKYEISELREAISDYDNILKNILEYIQECLSRVDKRRENLVCLFDCLCRLKKPGAPKPIYLHDIGHLFGGKLNVSNEKIEEVTGMIRDSLNDLIERH